MLAYRDTQGSWQAWTPRTRVNGLWPPHNAEVALNDAELAILGLYRVTHEPVPDGKIATSYSLVDVNGLPVSRPTLIDAPVPVVLTPAERAALLDQITGSMDTLELALRAVISLLADRMAITDAAAKTAVKNRMQAIAEGARG